MASTAIVLRSRSPMQVQQQSQKKKKKQNQKQKKNTKIVTTTKQVQMVKQPNRGPNRAAIRRREQFYLSPCSTSYLKALTNPFAMEAGLACIPDDNDVPSFKPLVIARGTFNVGTGGFGYILMNPSVGANDVGSIHTTTSAFTGGSFSTPATTGVAVTTIAQLPFNAASISATGVSHRTVGCGLRVRWLGTELNRSGRFIPYRSNACNIVTPLGITPGIALARPEVPSDPVDRQWHCVSYLPTATQGGNDCYGYSFQQAQINTTNLQSGDLGFIIDGSFAGSGVEYEIYLHKEYISSNGSIAPQGVTASHSDSVGLSAVRDALEGVLPSGNASKYFSDAMNYIQSWVPKDMSQVTSYVGAAGKTALALGWI